MVTTQPYPSHGHSFSSCTCHILLVIQLYYLTRPLTQQLCSPHMATHLGTMLNPYGQSINCTHHKCLLIKQLCSPHMATHVETVLTIQWPLTKQLYSTHMTTHTGAVLTTHGHSLTTCAKNTWPLAHQSYSPHMTIRTAAVLTTHDHSFSSCTHHIWLIIQQLHYRTWPLTQQFTTHHTCPLNQQVYPTQLATHSAAVLITPGHSFSNCAHNTWPLT